MVKLARVERSGDEETVRLPSGFRLGVDEVEVTQFGDVVVLKALRSCSNDQIMDALAEEQGFTPDAIAAMLEDPGEQHRPGLDKLFP